MTESENGEGKIKTSGGPNVKAETPLKCRLATCSYKAFEPSMGNAVRITRFLPHCELPYELAGSAMVLAPTWSEWGLAKNGGSGERFVAAYRARMDTLGVNTIEPVLGHATGALRRSLHFVIGGGRGLTHPPRIDRSPLSKVRTDQLVEILDKETTSMQAGMAPHRGGERLDSGAVATVPGKWNTPSALAAAEAIAVRPGITPSSRGGGMD